MLVKYSVGNIRSLLQPDHQIERSTILSDFTAPGYNPNIFITPSLRCKTATLVHLKMLKSQAAFHREVPAVYVDAILVFTKNMYSMFIECDVPIIFAQVYAEQLRNVDTVIQRELKTPYRVAKVKRLYVLFHLCHQPHRKMCWLVSCPCCVASCE